MAGLSNIFGSDPDEHDGDVSVAPGQDDGSGVMRFDPDHPSGDEHEHSTYDSGTGGGLHVGAPEPGAPLIGENLFTADGTDRDGLD